MGADSVVENQSSKHVGRSHTLEIVELMSEDFFSSSVGDVSLSDHDLKSLKFIGKTHDFGKLSRSRYGYIGNCPAFQATSIAPIREVKADEGL